MRHFSIGARASARQGLVWVSIVAFFAAFFAASTTSAALTFDLRAVSGSQVTIHGPKSVAVTQNSVGGWIDFELWGISTGANSTPFDDWVQNFAGDMLSDQWGNGAVAGSMVNSGEMASRTRRGIVQPFDNTGYRDGELRNLDEDADLEIGGTDPVNQFFESIAGRTGSAILFTGTNAVAEFLLYRFTLPIDGINAHSVEDITSVRFSPHPFRSAFLWAEDAAFLTASAGSMYIAPSVLIHTAQTPEELAAIPEPATFVLGSMALIGLVFARRRRSKVRHAAVALILVASMAALATRPADAALTFDLRAVSGSQVTIHNPKSVAVTQNSVGGWIDFELHALVTGQNNSSNDEALHSFAGNVFSTHFGRGAVSGDLINTGDFAPRVRRGIAAPFDHFGYSDGWAQNLDGDPDLEIGGTGESYWNHNTLVPTSTRGAIIGRGNPFNVYGYAGDGGVADFLLYRFTLPIASLLAGGLEDLTSIYFEPWNGSAAGHWREDGLGKSRINGGTVAVGESVLIHTAETPSDVASIPEPGAWLLGTTALAGLVFARRRRGVRFVAMPRSFSTFAWLATVSVLLIAGSANAALTFDLRAVSGSQVTIHNPKSVRVTQNSVGGWVDFELWARVSGNNELTADEGLQSFAGNMLSTHLALGAAGGSMVNTGEFAPRALRGIVTPFDMNGHQRGTVQNLDDDPDNEIGGKSWNAASGIIAGRSGLDPFTSASSDEVASFLLYRFTLPIESVPAQSLADMTSVHFVRSMNPANHIWFEDGVSARASGGTVLINDSVLIHTAQTPEELAAIPEPGTWLLAALALVGFALTLRLRPTSVVVLKRLASIVVVLLSLLCWTASTANADFTFDLRAVSGSQIIIHDPKSVAVNQLSVGGWIDFELWGLVTGSNDTPTDDWIENFVGSMRSDQWGNGAVGGSMDNTGEVAPHVRRGVVTPFDNVAYQDGRLQNLDNDADLEIGGPTATSRIGGMIAGRTGRDIYYFGSNPVADFLLYRFMLPIERINAQSLNDITSIRFQPDHAGTSFKWEEDDIAKNATTGPNGGEMNAGDSVLIHTADTPEELALIPEPGTWALGLSGMVGAGWFARRRRRR